MSASKEDEIIAKKQGFKAHCKSLIYNCRQIPDDAFANKSYISLLRDLKSDLASQKAVKAYLVVHRMLEFAVKDAKFNVKKLPDPKIFVEFTCKTIETDFANGNGKYYEKLFDGDEKSRELLTELLQIEKIGSQHLVSLLCNAIDRDSVHDFAALVEIGKKAHIALDKGEYEELYYDMILPQNKSKLKEYLEPMFSKKESEEVSAMPDEEFDEEDTESRDGDGSSADADESELLESPEVVHDIHSEAKQLISLLLFYAHKGDPEWVRTIFENHSSQDTNRLKQGAGIKQSIDNIIMYVKSKNIYGIASVINDILPSDQIVEPDTMFSLINDALEEVQEIESTGTDATFAVSVSKAYGGKVPQIRKAWDKTKHELTLAEVKSTSTAFSEDNPCYIHNMHHTRLSDLSSLAKPVIRRKESFNDSAISGCSESEASYTGYESSSSSRSSKYDHVPPKVNSFREPGELDDLRDMVKKNHYKHKSKKSSGGESEKFFAHTVKDLMSKMHLVDPRDHYQQKHHDDSFDTHRGGIGPLSDDAYSPRSYNLSGFVRHYDDDATY